MILFSLVLCLQLMKMMRFAETQDEDYCIAWCDDGRSFVIRNCNEFTRTVVPKYFKPTKFSSFTRKLYRWGFRQINRGLGPDDPVIFGCAHFQRDAPEEMANMRSVTAAATRKDVVVMPNNTSGMTEGGAALHPMMMQQHQQASSTQHAGTKRALEESFYHQEESLQKRLLLSKLLQQQTMMQQQQQSHHHHHQGSFFGNVNPNSALAMASMQHHPAAGYHHHGYHTPHHGYHNNNNGMDQGAALKPYYMAPPYNAGPTSSYGAAAGAGGEPTRTAEIVNAAIAALRNA